MPCSALCSPPGGLEDCFNPAADAPFTEGQLAELLHLFQQQQQQQQQAALQSLQGSPQCTPEGSETQPVLAGDLAGAEEAIDAEISQLLALKQARLQQRYAQLQLLQQVAAAGCQSSSMAVPADSLLREITLAPQEQDVAAQLAALQCRAPSSSMSLSEPSWAPAQGISIQLGHHTNMSAAQGAAGLNPRGASSRASIDLGFLQHSLPSPTTSFDTSLQSDMHSAGSDVMPSPFGGALPLQAPFTAAGVPAIAPAGVYTAPLDHAMLPAAAAADSGGLTSPADMAAALVAISMQDSSMLLAPQLSCSTNSPLSPAMSRVGSSSLLGSMQGLQGQQRLGGTSGPLLLPTSLDFAPSGAQAQMMFASSGGHPGAPHMLGARPAPAHRASFNVPPLHTAAEPQAKLRRHSCHLPPSTYLMLGSPAAAYPGPAQLQAAAGRGCAGAMPSGRDCYAAPQDSMRMGGRFRRMSVEVYSSNAVPRPHMHGQQQTLSGVPVQGMLDGAGYAAGIYGMEAYATVAPGSMQAAAVPQVVLDAGCCRTGVQSEARDAAAHCSIDARSRAAVGGAARRQSLDMPARPVGPHPRAPTCQPKQQERQENLSPPVRKGTGVFMPRVAAMPAASTGCKKQAST